jgi:hypothetical protein
VFPSLTRCAISPALTDTGALFLHSLGLDAGWVGQGTQYLPLADWAQEHRKTNPEQLWVNRDGGVVEDYLTPENPPPSSLTTTGLSLRPKPWEVCMTLGQKWAYNPHDVYKSTKTVIQTLVSVVATGGSLLLDIGPMPTGELPPVALQRLAETGKWMKVNSESIYETMPQSPYAMNVTGSIQRGKPGQWGLLSPATRGESAACEEARATNGSVNRQFSLADCQAYCTAIRGCNTINFRAPSTCIPKTCSVRRHLPATITQTATADAPPRYATMNNGRDNGNDVP